MSIDRILVIGAGLMGSGIAQVAAQSGIKVCMHDVDEASLERGLNSIKYSLGRFVKKGRFTLDERDEILNRIEVTTDLGRSAQAQLVIEAIFENMELKQKIFRELDKVCPTKTYFASNTSALSITELASVTGRPEKVIGMHFFSPVPMMKLLEIVKGMHTSEETVKVAERVGKRMGKETVVAKRDFGGFLLNRIALPYSRMAIVALTEGVGTPEDIDKGMRLGFGMPMGPLELADLTGIDVLLHAMTAIYEDIGDEAFCPPPLLKRMVDAGRLGRKVGYGFYKYAENGKKIID
ncbi:3-hydroxyacyl-CoA dehydrogenase NAD-binding domain-containing protein [Metallumcola ferriviriculae]|uniref:3-hydroxybutyryl-CoA dehydrogenase n=1 Tax=Metallumcola ferriviriculae TaxID=3039180 RepID=A0AAU0UPG6_9FIRM|nr:3-hydroxyacyl-CoA dehydrogenase NAD-binding domain-containing protein [Desulfitibacteraceae bacterium MK1]